MTLTALAARGGATADVRPAHARSRTDGTTPYGLRRDGVMHAVLDLFLHVHLASAMAASGVDMMVNVRLPPYDLGMSTAGRDMANPATA
jgi:hypothetical protein